MWLQHWTQTHLQRVRRRMNFRGAVPWLLIPRRLRERPMCWWGRIHSEEGGHWKRNRQFRKRKRRSWPLLRMAEEEHWGWLRNRKRPMGAEAGHCETAVGGRTDSQRIGGCFLGWRRMDPQLGMRTQKSPHVKAFQLQLRSWSRCQERSVEPPPKKPLQLERGLNCGYLRWTGWLFLLGIFSAENVKCGFSSNLAVPTFLFKRAVTFLFLFQFLTLSFAAFNFSIFLPGSLMMIFRRRTVSQKEVDAKKSYILIIFLFSFWSGLTSIWLRSLAVLVFLDIFVPSLFVIAWRGSALNASIIPLKRPWTCDNMKYFFKNNDMVRYFDPVTSSLTWLTHFQLPSSPNESRFGGLWELWCLKMNSSCQK